MPCMVRSLEDVVTDIVPGNAEVLLLPITLGCKTKVAKVIGISIAALQRLVTLGGVPTVCPTRGVALTTRAPYQRY